MASKRGALSWGAEAQRRAEKLSESERPAWLPTQEQIDGYFAALRGSRILVTGARDWDDRRSVGASLKRALKFLNVYDPEDATLVHGGEIKGADRLASSIAQRMGLLLERHRMIDGPALDGVDGDILLGFLREDDGPNELVESWILADMPVILCRQSGQREQVSGEFLNMQRF